MMMENIVYFYINIEGERIHRTSETTHKLFTLKLFKTKYNRKQTADLKMDICLVNI